MAIQIDLEAAKEKGRRDFLRKKRDNVKWVRRNAKIAANPSHKNRLIKRLRTLKEAILIRRSHECLGASLYDWSLAMALSLSGEVENGLYPWLHMVDHEQEAK